MKNKIILTMLIGMLCFPSLFASGNQESESIGTGTSDWLIENTNDHLTIIDNGGHKVTIEKPIERVLVTGMAVFSAIRALQAEELIIATHGIDKKGGGILFPYMSKLPVLAPEGGPSSFDYEKIVQMDPDLFLVLSFNRDQITEGLTPAGIPVVQLDFGSNKDILILGTLLGKGKEAEEYVSWIEDKTSNIEDKIKDLTLEEIPSVFLFYGGAYGMAPPPPYGSYGRDNLIANKIVKMAGGRSITAASPGEWINVDPEWIIEQNPETLIREYYDHTGTDDPELGYTSSGNEKARAMMDKIISMPSFETSNAVKEKNVHMVFGPLFSEYWFVGIQYMAKWLHPDLFEDLDPSSIYQEFLTRFMRVDYNIYEQGIFSYSAE